MTKSQRPGGPPSPHEGYHHFEDRRVPQRAQQVRRRSAQRASSPILVGLVYGAIGLLAVAVGVVTFLVISPPTDFIRNEIVARVKTETGRDLRIAGQASLSFYPTLGVRLGDVSLSPPPGMGGPPFVKISNLDIGVRLLPLLRQEIVVDKFVLYNPVFELRVDGNGKKSWDMALRATSGPIRLAEATRAQNTLRDFSTGTKGFLEKRLVQGQGAAGVPNGSAANSPISELVLNDIRIDNGTLRYSDERDGSSAQVGAINARLDLASLSQPLGAKGSLVWSKEKIEFDGQLTSPQLLLEERPAKLAFTVSSRPINISYDGSMTAGKAFKLNGAVDGQANSLRGLAQWLGTDLPPAPGFGKLSLAGQLTTTESAVRLSQAKIALDGATATGAVGVALAGVRPHVVADLKVSGLNLGNYAADEMDSGSSSGKRRRPTSSRAAPKSSEPQTIEELLKRSEPKVKGYAKRSGWSDQPLDLTLLGLVDANANLSVEQLSYGDIKLESTQLAVALRDRIVKATFNDVKLYKGRGNGAVTLNGTANTAVLGANFALSGVAAEPLLKDAAGMDWLAGTGNFTLALTGSGRTEAAIVAALNGKIDVVMSDGALIGFNLGGALRALSRGEIPDFSSAPTDKTDFSALTASFNIENGIARNNDLKLASPLMRATGAGTFNLPQRTLNYTVRPKLVGSLSGQGGRTDLSGIEVPVNITGPWNNPEIAPDIAGALNSEGTVEAVKSIGKQFKGKNAEEIVDDLFGKGEDGGPSKAQKLIDGFLGR